MILKKEYNLFFKEKKNNCFDKLMEYNNNSFILDLIENNRYLYFSADIKPEFDIIKKKQKNKLFF